MNVAPKSILNSKAVNGWNLFFLVSLPMSLVVIVEMMSADVSTGPGVSSMIGYSVRLAVPFIYLAVAASAVQKLFPGDLSNWWLRNRKYIGLCFAVAMAWQGTFIFMMSNFFRDYYYDNVYLLRDELEGSVGYIFLAAMVVTSFRSGRKHLTPKQWKLLHTCGMFFLWAYPFSVYWWNLSYYGNPEIIDYIFYWSGFLVVALRIAAWGKERRDSASKMDPDGNTPVIFKTLGAATIAFGIVAASTGDLWQESGTAFLTGPEWSANLVLWLPFWPFEPYLSLFIIALGTRIATHVRPALVQQELTQS